MKPMNLSPPQYKGLVALLAVDQYDLTKEVRVSDRTDVTRPWCLLIHSRVAEALVKVGLARTYLRSVGDAYETHACHTPLAEFELKRTLALRQDVTAAVETLTKAEAEAKAERESPEGQKLLVAALAFKKQLPSE